MDLNDHQIKLLKICDAIRWGESERLSLYNYHLLRRGLGTGDPVIAFEVEQAVAFSKAFHDSGLPQPASPPPGPERSPWMETWSVPWWRVEAIELEDPDLSAFEDQSAFEQEQPETPAGAPGRPPGGASGVVPPEDPPEAP